MATKDNSTSYEEIRRRRLEENKKRMEELGLNDLSQNLSKHLSPLSKSPSTRPRKLHTLKQTVTVQLRRSSRVANNPAPDYREVEIDIPLGRHRARFENFGCSRYYRNMPRKYASHAARMEAADKAETLLKELDTKNPSFVKLMLQSHVSGGFWLGLPSAFCKTYLPLRDEMIVLEDENSEEWETVYLSHKTGLSGGWRGFSLDHCLEDGDALIFDLVQHNKFKVYIVRVNEYESNVEDQETVEDSVVKTANKDEIAEGTPNNNNSKRKQILIREEMQIKDGEELIEKTEMKAAVKDREVEDVRMSNDDGRKASATEIKETVEGKREDDVQLLNDDGRRKRQKLLTHMLRSKKTHDLSMAEGKNDKLPANEIIEVC